MPCIALATLSASKFVNTRTSQCLASSSLPARWYIGSSCSTRGRVTPVLLYSAELPNRNSETNHRVSLLLIMGWRPAFSSPAESASLVGKLDGAYLLAIFRSPLGEGTLDGD